MNTLRLITTLIVVCGISCCVSVVDASALPQGREYEMVSPVFKGGFGALRVWSAALDGESVAYNSPGSFNSAPSGGELGEDYIARRSASGWSTTSLIPPASLVVVQEPKDMSPSLDLELDQGRPGTETEIAKFLDNKEALLLYQTDLPDVAQNWDNDIFESVGEQKMYLTYLGSDPNFCHSLAIVDGFPLVQEAAETNGQLYEIDRGCDGSTASVTLVGVNNKDHIINRECKVDLGINQYAQGINKFNAISADGSEVFFTDCLRGASEPASPHQLFLRLGGARTLEVSRPLEVSKPFGGCEGEGVPGEVPCEGAVARASSDFAGASEDGSKVYFTTSGQLIGADTDTGNDLYLATVGCSDVNPKCQVVEREVTSLTQVSHDPNGGSAEVQGVVRVAPNGQRAYFVASGDLLSPAQQHGLEGEGRATPHVGASNLYVYDSTSQTIGFIADLCSGKELSGSVEDVRCPSEETDMTLWSGGGEETGESQTAGPGGSFLVFASRAQLTANDTNAAKDVYRYNAEAGRLARVSIGENGYDANGTNGLLGASIAQGHEGGPVRLQYELDNRAISEDGSRIVFTSAEPLSPSAANGLVNAYEWHADPEGGEGNVSLVSTGSDEEPVKDVVISPNGLSVFFVTVQDLAPQDVDGVPDLYDARLEGGFPPPIAPRRPCEGDACQGSLTNPAPLLVPGSTSQAPGGNFAEAQSKPSTKTKKKTKKVKKKKVKARKKRGSRRGRSSTRSGSTEKADRGNGR